MQIFLETNNTIPVLISIMGWFVVHFLSAKRDKKKHLFDESTVLYTELTSICSMASNCHIDMDTSAVSTQELKSLAMRCDLFKKRLYAFLNSCDNCYNSKPQQSNIQGSIIAFRRALTSDDYKTPLAFRMALHLSYNALEKEISAIRSRLY